MYFLFMFFLSYLLLSLGFYFTFFFGGFIINFFIFSLGGLDVSFSFFFDYVSFLFFASVSFIASMIFYYSFFYMSGIVDSRRFYWLVFGFVISMAFLVFSGNFLTMMIGWDGLGLISFCLVIFYSNYSSLESGLVTVFSNRVGDVFFLGCFVVYFVGVSGVSDMFSGLSFLLFSFLFLGAITKSAQFPFSAWLPAAMAAPTPVSSLVHSSTLVTAGVYVLVRFNYLFFHFESVLMKSVFVFTMILAGFCANFEMDFKKVVAMSTLSQLGMMMFVLSVGVWVLTLMHMIIHAFFKSLLFMSTGSLMSSLGGGQDSRFYGGNWFSLGSFLGFLVSSVCLMGFPFFIGFYSKDGILLSSSITLGVVFYLAFLGGCFLTVCYSMRLVSQSFSGMLLGVSYGSYVENKVFLFSIVFLFFKTWILGNLFFLCFFFDLSSCFFGFDFLVGLFLITFSFFLFRSLKLIFQGMFYLFSIGFLRWFSSSGVSSGFPVLSYFRWDSSWLEVSGGQGVYYFLSYFHTFDFYKYLSLGVILFVFLFTISFYTF